MLQDYVVWNMEVMIISMRELEAASADECLEVFGTGTAAVVSSVQSICCVGRTISCGMLDVQEIGELAVKMRGWVGARQYGDDEHEWSVLVDELVKSPRVKL